MNIPDITFRNTVPPFTQLTGLSFIQSKVGSGALPILQGEESNPVLFRIYNNFALNSGIADAINISVTVFDGATTMSHTALTAPVSQSWLKIQEHGFGQNSNNIFDVYTRYDGIETAIGFPNSYTPEKGSDGTFSPSPKISGSAVGDGYIEFKSYIQVPDNAVGNVYNFVISLAYEYVV